MYYLKTYYSFVFFIFLLQHKILKKLNKLRFFFKCVQVNNFIQLQTNVKTV